MSKMMVFHIYHVMTMAVKRYEECQVLSKKALISPTMFKHLEFSWRNNLGNRSKNFR